MSWVAVTVEDLNDRKVSALVDSLRTAALASGQSDPAPRIIADVVTRIRAEVKGCASNRLDADTAKIPEDLKSLACRMIVRELQSRLQMALTDDEKEEWRQDVRYLERISKCELPVAVSDNPVDGGVQSVSGTPRITARPRTFDRDQQEGL